MLSVKYTYLGTASKHMTYVSIIAFVGGKKTKMLKFVMYVTVMYVTTVKALIYI